jgi:hypothetical protein
MSEMIERGARALATKHYVNRFGRPEDDAIVVGNVDANWHIFSEDSRTVIDAMREPTEAMINNPLARCYNTGQFADKEVRRIYSSMIDEALK